MTQVGLDWGNALDFQRALTHCHYDLIGDWYRDPWGWPELAWIVESEPDLLAARLNSESRRLSLALDVPKENFGIRPAIVMDPVDRLAYQALVDRCAPKLVERTRPWVFVGRIARNERPATGIYADAGDEFELYRQFLNACLQRWPMLLTTDVVSFFASAPVSRVIDRIYSLSGENRVTDRLADMLEYWERALGRGGLPQRFLASSVLANSFLQPVDDALTLYNGPRSRTYKTARWMDDIWAFGTSEEPLRRLQLELAEVMRSLGLNMNLAKTRVLEGGEAEAEVKRRELSAIDRSLSQPEPDFGPLNELLDSILSAPEAADRTRVRFATRRMRRTDTYERLDEFVDAAPRMPHVADILARLFRDSNAWRDLGGWFVNYAQTDWAVEWSIGQFATMFPTREQPPDGITDFLSSALTHTRSLVVGAVAAQRLASWDPDVCRIALRESADQHDHPLMRRVLAFAALDANEDRQWVRQLLSQFEENRPTISVLSGRRFRPVPPAADFAGD